MQKLRLMWASMLAMTGIATTQAPSKSLPTQNTPATGYTPKLGRDRTPGPKRPSGAKLDRHASEGRIGTYSGNRP